MKLALILANTILAGHFPYLIALYLSPLVLGAESFTIRWLGKNSISVVASLRAALAANIASFFVGLSLNQGGIRGLETAGKALTVTTAIGWALLMSVIVEYLVLRLMLKQASIMNCVQMAVAMNACSYALIITPGFVWIASI